MAKLTKRTGVQEDFRRDKAETSLRRAGIADDVIRQALDRIRPKEDESTTSFRQRLVTELRARDANSARRYDNTRRLRAASSKDVDEGTIRVNPSTLRSYGWKQGAEVQLEHAGNTARVKIEESPAAEARAMHMSPKTMNTLHAPEGTRLNISPAS